MGEFSPEPQGTSAMIVELLQLGLLLTLAFLAGATVGCLLAHAVRGK